MFDTKHIHCLRALKNHEIDSFISQWNNSIFIESWPFNPFSALHVHRKKYVLWPYVALLLSKVDYIYYIITWQPPWIYWLFLVKKNRVKLEFNTNLWFITSTEKFGLRDGIIQIRSH